MAARDINLYKVYNRKPEMNGGKKSLIIFGAAAAAAAAVFGGAIFGMNAELRSLDAQCKSEQAYLDDKTVQEASARYNEVLSEYTRELSLAEELEIAVSALKSYPTVNSPLLRAVNSAAGEHSDILSVDYADTNGILRLEGESKDFYEGANYASRLEGLNRFLEVGYHGYYLDEDTYAFEDDCYIKPGAVNTQR